MSQPHNLNEFVVRTPTTYTTAGGQLINQQAYYRFHGHGGTLPLLQHSHLLAGAAHNNSNGTPVGEPLTMAEIAPGGSLESTSNEFYSITSSAYSPGQPTLLHQPTADLMTNAFTYNVATSGDGSLYPISTELLTISGGNANGRNYSELSAASGGPASQPAHVTLGGTMMGCIDSLSSTSASDKTLEVDEEWRLPKPMPPHQHQILVGSHHASFSAVPTSQAYVTYGNIRSTEVCKCLTIIFLI